MSMRTGFFRAAVRLLGLLALTALLLFLLAGVLPLRNPRTPAGFPCLESTLISTPEGLRLAARVLLPRNLAPGQKLPAVLEATRYGTLPRPSFFLRALLNLRLASLGLAPGRPAEAAQLALAAGRGRGVGAVMETALASGYAYVALDARGSGASFGSRPMEFAREELGDLGAAIDWIAGQPWSDGNVVSFGVSVSANYAEFAAATCRPALRAAVLLFPDFDPVAQNARPGGILNRALVEGWSAANQVLDAGGERNLFWAGTAPVDLPGGARLLRQALREHRTLDLPRALAAAECLDDELAPGYRSWDLAPASREREIEAAGLPLYVRVGWLDAATANGALERYLRYANPQELVLGPWNHGGSAACDPFLPAEGLSRKLEAAQAAEVLDFLDRCLGRSPGEEPRGKSLRYYCFGEAAWHVANSWPLPGLSPTRWYLGPAGSLAAERPREVGAEDGYAVDFGASSGTGNRWRTNFGGGLVAYPDRAEADRRILVYESEPLPADRWLIGAGALTLRLSSSASDGAIHAYLEDVGPDGRITYLTEGLLRLAHRRESRDELLGEALGPLHSFRRADAHDVVPGEPAEARIALLSTAAQIKKGHRIRLAIAGADAASFERIPAAGEVLLRLGRGADHPSWLELPLGARP